MMRITGEYQTDRQMLMDYLRAEASFDVVAKPLKIGGHSALLLMIDGFVKDDIMEKVFPFCPGRGSGEMADAGSVRRSDDPVC